MTRQRRRSCRSPAARRRQPRVRPFVAARTVLGRYPIDRGCKGQTWRDLLFAHWSLPEDRLRALVPDAISIDTFEQPDSLRMQVDLVNSVTSAAQRRLDFVSFTVPQDRDDNAYFDPSGAGDPLGHRAELRARSPPPGRSGSAETACQIERIDTALAVSSRRRSRLGDLHRVRNGPRRRHRRARIARPPPAQSSPRHAEGQTTPRQRGWRPGE